MKIKKISVIGNACSGKTTLSRKLAERYELPLTHVDSIQFLPGLKLRNPDETRKTLQEISERDMWIIDGYGPLKIIEKRFQKSDLVIYIKFPLWRNYWWCLKRQVKGIFFRRSELPEGCFEFTLPRIFLMCRTIWNVHFGMTPQLERIFKQDIYRGKVLVVESMRVWNKVFREGLTNDSH